MGEEGTVTLKKQAAIAVLVGMAGSRGLVARVTDKRRDHGPRPTLWTDGQATQCPMTAEEAGGVCLSCRATEGRGPQEHSSVKVKVPQYTCTIRWQVNRIPAVHKWQITQP
jgi:hypothetical protein